jgi:hypothetical protein
VTGNKSSYEASYRRSPSQWGSPTPTPNPGVGRGARRGRGVCTGLGHVLRAQCSRLCFLFEGNGFLTILIYTGYEKKFDSQWVWGRVSFRCGIAVSLAGR